MNFQLFALIMIKAYVLSMEIKYSFVGIKPQLFSDVLCKYPIPVLIKTIEHMGNGTEMILRPFNFGSTKSYE